MTDPNHVFGRPAPGQSSDVYAEVSRLQPAPTHFTDPLFVVFPDYSIDIAFRIDQWPAIHGATFPAIGAPVLVQIDSRNNKRVTWWSGVYS